MVHGSFSAQEPLAKRLAQILLGLGDDGETWWPRRGLDPDFSPTIAICLAAERPALSFR